MFKETREKIEMLAINGIEQNLLKAIWKELVRINDNLEVLNGKSNDQKRTNNNL